MERCWRVDEAHVLPRASEARCHVSLSVSVCVCERGRLSWARCKCVDDFFSSRENFDFCFCNSFPPVGINVVACSFLACCCLFFGLRFLCLRP
jgi:hypothetical protein